MDEQNNQEQSTTECKKTIDSGVNNCLKQDCWKKCLAMTLAAFLGGFLAVYFVADRVYHNKYEKKYISHQKMHQFDRNREFNDDFFKPDFPEVQFRTIEKAEQEMMDDLNINPFSMLPVLSNPVKVRTYYDDKDNFKVVIDTKSFKNDDKKIDYKIQGRKLTVSCKAEIKEKDYESDISFSQDLILPRNAKTSEVSASQEEDKWVLTIPVEKK